MKWKRTPPKEDGYYWCLRGDEPVVVKIFTSGRYRFVDSRISSGLLKDWHDAHYVRTYWAGPIEMYPPIDGLDRSELDV